jgi:uncharacterized protein (DUF849 family)
VEDAKRCAALGVSIVHLHARDGNGMPTYHKEIYGRLIGAIRESCPDIIICVSLSGRVFSEFEQRIDPLLLQGDLKPDMASLTLSSMNFSQMASINSPEMIRRLVERMAEADIKPELEIFDVGMLNYASFLADRGLIKPPFYFNLLLGNIANAQAKPSHLGLMLSELPADSYWSGGSVGPAQLAMNTMGILFGNGVRVGLEDYLWLDTERKQLASNILMVERIVELAGLLGREVATPMEVRAALRLPSYGC